MPEAATEPKKEAESNWYAPERPRVPATVTFGKRDAPQQNAQPALYPGEEPERVLWDQEQTRLLRTFGCRSTDIAQNIETPEQRRLLVESAKKGDAGAMKTLNLALNLYLECMGKTPAINKQQRDAQGRLLFFDNNGALTTRKFSQTVKDFDGNALRHRPAWADRTHWGVMEGADCITAAGTPIPQPGHYRTLVEDNFDDLFPRLFFLSDALDNREPDPTSGRPELRSSYMEFLKQQAADDGLRRSQLLKWLPQFLKNPQTTWDGRV